MGRGRGISETGRDENFKGVGWKGWEVTGEIKGTCDGNYELNFKRV